MASLPDPDLGTGATTPLWAEVVILAGPSGSGKTHLAESVGLPIVTLDDFYRDGDDPALPRRRDGGIDWEDVRSWHRDEALAALRTICTASDVAVPTYEKSQDRRTGRHRLARGDAPIVIAEGIFACHLIEPLRHEGLLADALLIEENRWLTFLRRLGRDRREARKPTVELLRTGWAKTRAEPAIMAELRRLGARPVSKAEARRRLAELAARRRRQPPVASAEADGPGPDRAADVA